MIYIKAIATMIAGVLCLAASSLDPVSASAQYQVATPRKLSFAQMKATGDELVIIYNNSGADIPLLSQYQLQAYSNVQPLDVQASLSTQQLPAVSLPSGASLLLSDEVMSTCGAAVTGKLGVSLADSSGFLQLAHVTQQANGGIAQTPVDWVSWSSKSAGDIANMASNSKDPYGLYFRQKTANEYVWQHAQYAPDDICQLNVLVAGDTTSTNAVTPLALAATSPPATILETESPVQRAIARNKGLLMPQISELLPNPSGTGNDATDEFIEIYNPNSATFSIGGYILQTGTKSLRSYAFPDDMKLPGKSFTVIYAKQSRLTLSNTASQAALLDPAGKVLSYSDEYSKAKDGITWALANKTWSWTSRPTPGAANVIVSPDTKSSAKLPTASLPAGSQHTASAATEDITAEQAAPPVHAWVLAAIVIGAVLYGAYEYRRDISNTVHRLAGKFSRSNPPGTQS